MKWFIILLCATLICVDVFSQSPKKISYQAVVRDANGDLVNNTSIGVRFSLVQGSATGLVEYIETHNKTSNKNGLISLEIGDGTATFGSFSSIDWADGPWFLKSEIDPIGGINYVIRSTNQLMSVPYALHSITAENLSTPYPENDPIYGVSTASGISGTDTAYWNNKLDIESDPIFNTSLAGSITGTDTAFWNNKLDAESDPIYNASVAGAITITDTAYWNNKLNVEIDGSVTNEIQSLSLSNDSLFIQGGNAIFLGGYKDTSWSRSGNYVYTTNDSVGIGTSTPGSKLDISGHIWQTGTGLSVFIGEGAGANDDLSNNENVFVGYQTGSSNTSGWKNTAIGYSALSSNIIGILNTASGSNALYNNTGIGNTANGSNALYFNTTGFQNTASGLNALYSNTTGNNNTALGYYAFYNGANYDNSTALGYNTVVGGSNQLHLGNTSVTEIKGQVSFSTYSDGRIKDNVSESVIGLDFINRLRPVTYNFNVDKQNELMGVTDSSEYAEKYDIEKINFSGFIAQEVEKAANETGYDFSGVKVPLNDKNLYGLSYAEFVVPLVKAMQEQQKMIQEQLDMIGDLLKQIDELNARIDNL